MVTRFPAALDSVASLQPQGNNGQSASQMTMNVAAAVVAVETALAAGGVPLDSLTLNDYIAIGAGVAAAGAIRLAQDGVIAARNVADDADVEIAQVTSFTNGATDYDLLSLLGGKVVIDPDYNSVVALLANYGLVCAPDAAYGDGDPVFAGAHTQVNPSGLDVRGSGTARATLQQVAANDLTMTLIGLPTADPMMAGAVWVDTGVLTVSAG